MAFHFIIERSFSNIQLFNSFRYVAMIYFQCIQNNVLFKIGNQVSQGSPINPLQIVLLGGQIFGARRAVKKKLIICYDIVFCH